MDWKKKMLNAKLKNLKDENKKLKVKKKSQAKPRGSAKKRQWVMQDLTSESDDEAIRKRNFESLLDEYPEFAIVKQARRQYKMPG